MASFNFASNLGIKSLNKFSHELYLGPISGSVRQALKSALVLLYCGSLTDFGELSINVLVLRWSKATQELSLELSPRRDSVIGLGWPVVRRRHQRVTVVRIATGGRKRAGVATIVDSRGGWVALEGATTTELDLQEGRVSKAKRGCECCGWQRRKEEGSDSLVRVAAMGEQRGPKGAVRGWSNGGGGDAGEGREMKEMAGGVGLQAADGAGDGNRQRH
ncbi:hypothetical protein BHM03_00043009 [Ensete ventricosum]|nr:hypothetical protein BHM03_00043009 [Ensete ventricosum]